MLAGSDGADEHCDEDECDCGDEDGDDDDLGLREGG